MMIKKSNLETLIESNKALSQKIYELDFALWCLLQKLAHEQPDIAANQFQIKPETVAQIAHADERQLRRLASRTFISFKSNLLEEKIIAYLMQTDNSLSLPIHVSNANLNERYWLTVYQAVIDTPLTATLRLGISQKLAQVIAKTHHHQLMQLANTVPIQFLPRCEEKYIIELLTKNENNDLIDAFCKKQFSTLTSSYAHVSII